jgi:hypothetical protein
LRRAFAGALLGWLTLFGKLYAEKLLISGKLGLLRVNGRREFSDASL